MEIYSSFNNYWVDSDSADLILRNHLYFNGDLENKKVYFIEGSALDRNKLKLKKCRRVLDIDKADVIVYPSVATTNRDVHICDMASQSFKQSYHPSSDVVAVPKGHYLRLDSNTKLDLIASIFQKYTDKIIISDQTAILNFNNGLTINQDNLDFFLGLLKSDYENQTLAITMINSMDLLGSGQWLNCLLLLLGEKFSYPIGIFRRTRDMQVVKKLLNLPGDYSSAPKRSWLNSYTLNSFNITNNNIINVIKQYADAN